MARSFPHQINLTCSLYCYEVRNTDSMTKFFAKLIEQFDEDMRDYFITSDLSDSASADRAGADQVNEKRAEIFKGGSIFEVSADKTYLSVAANELLEYYLNFADTDYSVEKNNCGNTFHITVLGHKITAMTVIECCHDTNWLKTIVYVE